MLIDFDGMEIVDIEEDEIVHLADLMVEEDLGLLNRMFWSFHCLGWWIGIRVCDDPSDAELLLRMTGESSHDIILAVRGYEGEVYYIEAAAAWYWREFMKYDADMFGSTHSYENIEAGLLRPAAPRSNFDWGDVQ